jgi:hypothetical protein
MEKTVKFACQPLPPHLKKNLKEQLDAWVTKGVVKKHPLLAPSVHHWYPSKRKTDKSDGQWIIVP